VAVSTVHYPGMGDHPDAMSRILQGIIQGVMAGVGFIGAGVIFRGRVRNLTTAATVWVTAALGVACALAAWEVVWIGAALSLLVLLLGKPSFESRQRVRSSRSRRG
jgi:putative Mg2+ transporter-C (MgtC) family protein